MGLAESAGFGLFVFATTMLKAISLLVGITFPFTAYTTLTALLGILTGPVGWIGIPVVIVSGYLLKSFAESPQYFTLKQVIIRIAYLRGDI